MDINTLIQTGKKCAYGIGQSVDLEKAYACWSCVENQLDAKDKKTLSYIKDALGLPSGKSNVNSLLGGVSSPATINIAATGGKVHRTENELRALFERLLNASRTQSNIDSLYSTLLRYEKDHFTVKEKKESHIRLGNNLGYLIFYFWTSVDNYFASMNTYRKSKGFEEKKSIQGVYQVIGGKNGMDNSSKLLLTEMVNTKIKSKGGLKRNLEVTDLELAFSDFFNLFEPKKYDDKTKLLLGL